MRAPASIARVLRTAARLAVGLGVGVAALALSVLIAVNVSPKPFAWVVQWQFAEGSPSRAAGPSILRELGPAVRVDRDIEYPSRFGRNRLDVFRPRHATSALPTILWMHGGGFVGGDKSDIATWATVIAAAGYTVVSINYGLAPHNRYPGPVVQLREVYRFMRRHPLRFRSADLGRLIVGGDSAGAQIASQFIAVETNPGLAKSMRLEPVVERGHLIAAILYCGPYDLRGLYDLPGWLPRFFVRQMGWAYFGVRHWKHSKEAWQASTVHHVTSDFPATFVTDGNTASFERDARQLETGLKKHGVQVESLFHAADGVRLGHEYQFDLALPEALDCYERTLAFLGRVTAGGGA